VPKLVLLAVLTLAVLASCASGPSAGQGPACELTSPDTLMLRGETNQTMLDCTTRLARPPVRTVVVDSTGGAVKTAIPIAEMLAVSTPRSSSEVSATPPAPTTSCP
jgi:hypothetical protein